MERNVDIPMPKFYTIRQLAKARVLSEYRLRAMLGEGVLPGIWAGAKFLVDAEKLAELLNSEDFRETMRLREAKP